MQIQINTDHTIVGTEAFAAHARGVVGRAIDRFRDRITRLEFHLRDENGDKTGTRDKRCMIEARLEVRRPPAVTHQAATVDEALRGTAEKLERSLETTVERTQDHRPH
jgi:hypothetical protein